MVLGWFAVDLLSLIGVAFIGFSVFFRLISVLLWVGFVA